jgi:hypothetical protein
MEVSNDSAQLLRGFAIKCSNTLKCFKIYVLRRTAELKKKSETFYSLYVRKFANPARLLQNNDADAVERPLRSTFILQS